jgi:chromosome partitioning protein
MNPTLKVTGVVLTMFDAQTKLSGEVVNELNGFIEQAKGQNLPWSNARVFQSKIRRNIKLAESPSFGQTIFSYGPTSNGALDYRLLASEVAQMSEAPAEPKVEVTMGPIVEAMSKPSAAKEAPQGADAAA